MVAIVFAACSPEAFPSVSEGGIPVASSYENAVGLLMEKLILQLTD